MRLYGRLVPVLLLYPLMLVQVPIAGAEIVADVWVSSEDMTRTLAHAEPLRFVPDEGSGVPRINVDGTRTYQSILGLGSSFEHTTCFNLSRLDPAKRDEVIERMVHPDSGIGMNLMRICIGTPDFTGEPWYSYDDMPPGETDPNLEHFSIEKDRNYIIPVLKTALEKNPDLLFVASPWSPPGWMTSTGDMIGGHLLPEYYDAYARYFVKFVRAYENEGVPIHAVTVQNEPGVDRGRGSPKWRYPSCRYTGEQERDFIKDFLGPAFKKNGVRTKIWCYDHNFNLERRGDDPGLPHPRTILSDPTAAQYVDGTAFHHYAGTPDGMTVFHNEFPDKHIYFTEGSAFGTTGAIGLISYLRNWSRSYNGWVTMIDTDGKPNNGPFRASRTCIMLNADDLTVDYRFDYYMYGQFMKFIRRGAVRTYSDEGKALPPRRRSRRSESAAEIDPEAEKKGPANVAFRNPDGSIVFVAANADSSPKRFTIVWNGLMIAPTLPGKSVATYLWRAE
jgi:O-glycosyl hydrolase